MRLISSYIFFLILASTPLSGAAQTYKWVDEDGNVHFGDQPPVNQEAKDISQDLDSVNIDSSTQTTRRILDQRDRYAESQRVEQAQSQQGNGSEATARKQRNIDSLCQKARQRLRIISGRVIFYDDAGKEVKVTEKERAQRAADLNREIQEYCAE